MNDKIINIFNKLYLYHVALDNLYESRAYKKIIDILKKYPDKIKSGDQLKNINGIGQRTIDKIDEILKTGELQILNELEKDPKIRARLELQKVLGIGPKLAEKYVNQGIMTIEDLKKSDIQLTEMQKIGLKYFRELNESISRKELTNFFIDIEKILKKKYKEILIIPAGSYRRGKSESGDIDLILSFKNDSESLNNIIEYLKKKNMIIEVVSQGENSVITIAKYRNKIRHLDIKMAPYDLIPFFLLYFGSGITFAREIRQIAKEKGYKLNEFGLYKGNKKIMKKAKDEKEIFNKLGIEYVEPENR